MNKRKCITAMIILIIDQLIKWLIQTYKVNYVIIKNIFSIKYVTNTGAAFSLFENSTIPLIIIAIVILVLVYNLSFSYKETKINDISFGLVYGGILGNLIDRCVFKYVRDFISIGKFPVFNIADMAIVIGVILLVILCFFGEREKKKVKKSED